MLAPDPRALLEHELKLLLPTRREASVRACLDSLCRPDPLYAENVVASLYYDNHQLDSLQEKIDSDLAKTKVRLRWYETAGGGWRSPSSYLEVKQRYGTRRQKDRQEVELGGDRIVSLPLPHPDLARLPLLLNGRTAIDGGALRPILVVRYLRRRYVEPSTGSRVSLDTGISVGRINPNLLPHLSPRRLDLAVLEVKNRQGEVPLALAAVFRLGSRLNSFSKYLACYDAAISSTVARF